MAERILIDWLEVATGLAVLIGLALVAEIDQILAEIEPQDQTGLAVDVAP